VTRAGAPGDLPDVGVLADPSVLGPRAFARAEPGGRAPAAAPEVVQTHLSTVFLTPERVYKFRKPVDLGFVRFASREERNADCLREVELNRRLAPDVYVGVAPLLAEGGALALGPVAEKLHDGADGSPAEHCVVMRRLAEERSALALLRAGALGVDDLDRLAERLARFHAEVGLGAPASFTPDAWHEACVRPVRENFEALERDGVDAVDPGVLDRVAKRARAFASQAAERLERRRRDGRAVDGHGDLHLDHVWIEHDGAEPIAIDCLEFAERLRHIDVASEIAFPVMDLAYRGHPALAARLLGSYAAATDDYDLFRVVDFFASYRAAVRAKVAAIAASEEEIPAEQRRRAQGSARAHLEQADAWLAPRGPARLVLVGGVVGTGKTTVARELADAARGAVVSSDRVRKHRFGGGAGEPAGEGAYTAAAKAAVYAGLLERAAPVVESGRVAVLDATFERGEERRRAAAWARDRGVALVCVETRCAREVALARLERRQAAGRDASDAGPARHDTSAAAFEPFADSFSEGDGAVETRVVDTDRDGWREHVQALGAGWAPPWAG